MRRLAVASGHFLFRFRNLLFPLLLIGLVAVDRPRLACGSPACKNALDAVGVLVAALGQALRILTIGLAYVRRGGRGGRVAADRLVVEGIFAHLRNPMYLGNFVAALGVALVFNGALVLAVGMPLLAFGYVCIVLAEEDFLRAKFGAEFARYSRTVHRFWPTFSGLRSTLRGSRFDWRHVLRKEYGTVFSCTTLLLGALVWSRWTVAGPETGFAWLRVLAPVWLLLVTLYLVVRQVKRSGRLGSGGSESPAPGANPS